MSPIRYRKSVQIFPWVRLNLNTKSWSITLGGKHTPHYTWSSTGRDSVSEDLPGGLSYRRTVNRRKSK